MEPNFQHALASAVLALQEAMQALSHRIEDTEVQLSLFEQHVVAIDAKVTAELAGRPAGPGLVPGAGGAALAPRQRLERQLEDCERRLREQEAAFQGAAALLGTLVTAGASRGGESAAGPQRGAAAAGERGAPREDTGLAARGPPAKPRACPELFPSLRRDGGQATAGSAGHPEGCTPCAFYSDCERGCKKGARCGYCHLEHPETGRPRPGAAAAGPRKAGRRKAEGCPVP